MKITEDNIATAVDYIVIAVTITIATLIMVSVGTALTDHLPTIV